VDVGSRGRTQRVSSNHARKAGAAAAAAAAPPTHPSPRPQCKRRARPAPGAARARCRPARRAAGRGCPTRRARGPRWRPTRPQRWPRNRRWGWTAGRRWGAPGGFMCKGLSRGEGGAHAAAPVAGGCDRQGRGGAALPSKCRLPIRRTPAPARGRARARQSPPLPHVDFRHQPQRLAVKCAAPPAHADQRRRPKRADRVGQPAGGRQAGVRKGQLVGREAAGGGALGRHLRARGRRVLWRRGRGGAEW
jgi:hypothetical protein